MTRIKSILSEACPNCQKGKVFQTKGSLLNFKFPKMNKQCKSCNYTFEKEPGYFFGAMYISYGLCFIEGMFLFLISRLFVESIFDIRVLLISLLSIVLLSFYNFRLSRILWMNIFTKPINKVGS